ncbi:MAG TPA: GNAT family protein [Solirubrobacteraceae bacterium]|nr:GNAT family protein [Solirubrobacteraceae bacterium]
MTVAGARRIVLSAEPLLDGPTTLRPWRDDDLPALAQIGRDPDVTHWMGLPREYRSSDARAYLMSRYDGLHVGVRAPYAIVASADGQLLGSIALAHFAWEAGRAEVGYWLSSAARGAGHATRAVRLICSWGFQALGLERIELQAAVDNPGSQRVAERAGFTREAVLRSRWTTYDGERHDMVCFGLLAGEL